MCHRDLKAINCLLFNPPGLPDQQPAAAGVLPKDQLHFLKLADMGIAKGVGPQPGAPSSDTLVATPSHRAPELQPGRHHTYNIDVWYLACLMLELLSARPPFAYLYDLEGLSEAEREARRSAAELDRSDCPYRDLLNEEEMAFARTCLETDPGVRPYLSYLMDENHLQRSTYLLG
jgi:serine/threonine protein kinase